MPDQDFISGALAGQEYRMNKFKLLEAPVKLEQEKLALKIGQQDYDRRQKVAEFLTQHSASIPDGLNPLTNAANSLVQLGAVEAGAGMVEESTKTLAQASSIMSQQEDVAYKQWQTVLQKTRFADQILAGVTDQHSFEQANAYIRQATGEPSALEGKQYSPELIEDLKKATQAKRTDAQEALTRIQTDKAKVEMEAAKELIPLRKSQESLNAAREAVIKKSGGGGLIASPKNIAAVTDYLVKDSGDSMSTADARVFARDIALDVEERMKRDRQTQPQAVASAVDWANKHGALAGIPPAHARPGQSAKKPLPLPDKVEDFKDRMWYEAPDGPRWFDEETGKVYKPGEGPKKKGEDEDEDEDDQ